MCSTNKSVNTIPVLKINNRKKQSRILLSNFRNEKFARGRSFCQPWRSDKS